MNFSKSMGYKVSIPKKKKKYTSSKQLENSFKNIKYIFIDKSRLNYSYKGEYVRIHKVIC